MTLLKRRKASNFIGFSASALATVLGIAVLTALLWTLITRGIQSISPALFTQMTPAPGSPGGLANAIFGSVLMTLLGIAAGAPIGLMAGTYLSEYGRGTKLAAVIRFINDVLLSAPSIIIGLFVYTIVVMRVGHFSALAGAMSLAIIAIPVVVRTSEDMLRLVPNSLREASAALGAAPWRTIVSTIYPAASSGLLTGLLLSIARISGETAPLLFTALNNQFWSTKLNAPMANLPSVIFQFAMSPYKDWQALAWSGALLITAFVLVLSVGARLLSAVSRGRSQGGT
ncbi:MAG TPA: phosphate ABC transporter permease PstA [Steroidobacteraceae bacterium]|nr:phosphate ABC transporter permease PstA [Steroidobacteraceae bacterium]